MPRSLFTDRRSQWALARRHSGVMRGKPLRLPAGVAMRYAERLQALVREMHDETTREITRLFQHPEVEAHLKTLTVGMDISPSAQARILTNKLKRKFEQLFGNEAKPAADTMTGQANSASATATASSLKELSGGLTLQTGIMTGAMSEFLTGTVATNVALIKSIPAEYFQKIQYEVLHSMTDGKGLADLVPELQKLGDTTERRAKNIAIDQTHKAYAGLNHGRMQAVGIKEFEWVHSSGGQHPRPIHLYDLNGRVFPFDKPPVIDEDGTRGFPAQLINCRCTMVPVVKFDEGKPAG